MPDVATRQIVIELLNVIETLAAENAALRVEIQQLGDAVAWLQGRSAQPDINPPTPPPAPPTDHSSEVERRTRTPRGKPKKHATLTVTHEERCVVDPVTLPPDAVRHGMTDSMVQRLRSDKVVGILEIGRPSQIDQFVSRPTSAFSGRSLRSRR